jgi:hypothetical protein
VPKYVVDTNLYVEAITTDEGNAALAAFQRRCAPFLFQHSRLPRRFSPAPPKRAVPGHTFGLSLTPDDKRALLAFLRSL